MGDEKKADKVREEPATYGDYANLPDDGNRYELVNGILELMSPSPSPDHQSISVEMIGRFLDTCKDDYVIYLAPIDLILSETVVRQPDLIIIHRDRFPKVVKKHGIVGPPDLVVEILSPSSVKRDRESKMKSYAQFSVPEYWIIDPRNKCIEQYILTGQQYALPHVYIEDDKVISSKIPCASLSINDILKNIPKIPED